MRETTSLSRQKMWQKGALVILAFLLSAVMVFASVFSPVAAYAANSSEQAITPLGSKRVLSTQFGSAKVVAWHATRDEPSMMASLLSGDVTLEESSGVTYATLTFISGAIMGQPVDIETQLDNVRSIGADGIAEYSATDISKGDGKYILKLQVDGTDNPTVKMKAAMLPSDSTLRLHFENILWWSNLSDGKYNIHVDLKKVSDRTATSTANSAIEHTANLEVRGGVYYLTLDLKSITVGGVTAYLKELSYYDPATYDASGNPVGVAKPATVISTQANPDGSNVIDEYNKGKGWLYPKLVEIPLIEKADGADGFVPLQMVIPFMDSIMPGTSIQDVLAKLDWSTLKVGEFQPPTEVVDLAWAKITPIADKAYTGKAIAPALTVKLGTATLVKGTDYDVAYKNNKAIGKAELTITGKGKYEGSKIGSFKIVPTKTSLTKLTAGKKQLKVAWKAVSKAQKITKYQIRYKVKGKSKWTTKTVSAKSKTLTLKKLKKGKKYQVQARSYKTVSKVKYYSAWSKTKTAKKIK